MYILCGMPSDTVTNEQTGSELSTVFFFPAHSSLTSWVPTYYIPLVKVGVVLKRLINNDFFSQEQSQSIRKALV